MTSKRCFGLLLVVAAGTLASACGDDSESPRGAGGTAGATGAEAGMPGTSGASEGGASSGGASGGGGSGGGQGGAATQSDDCTDYATAWCGSLLECAPYRSRRDYEDGANCVAVVRAGCAHEVELGSPIADFAGCIEALGEGDCNEVLSDLSGACQRETGDTAPGEPCTDGNQCRSGVCLFSGTQCGECSEVSEVGDPCGVGGVSCTAVGLTCDYAEEECVELEVLDVGDPCGESEVAWCRADLVCSQGECVAMLGEGEDCSADPNLCDSRRQLFCEDNECAPFVVMELGETCGLPGPRCSDYGFCDPDVLECLPRHDLDEECSDDPVAGSTCLPHLRCVDGTCVDATAGCLD